MAPTPVSAAGVASPAPVELVPRSVLLALFAVLYLLSFAGTGAGVGVGNHPLQIPLIQRLASPGFLAADPFVATLDRYASPLWQIVGFGARVVPWAPLLLVLLLAERALVLYAFGRLAGALAGGRPTAVVAGWAFAALVPRPLVADGTIVANYFEHTGIAIALIALAATALVERRHWRFALFWGLAIDCNVLYGIFAGSYLVPLYLLERRALPWRKGLAAVALAIALGAPAFYMVLGRGGGGPVDAPVWVDVLRSYYPDHFFPDTWERAAVRRLGLLLGAALALAFAVRRRQPELAPRLGLWVGGVLFWLAVSVVNARHLPIPDLFILHPARGGDPGLMLIALGALAGLAVELEDASGRGRRSAALALLVAAPLFFFVWSARTAVAAAAFAVLLQLGRERLPWVRPFLGARTAVAAALVAAVAFFNLSQLGKTRSLRRGPGEGERALAAWAKANSAPGALFLVDPSWNMFRPLAERQPFVTWKEGAAMMWRKDFVTLWRERLAALGYEVQGARSSLEDLGAVYDRLTDEKVRQLGRRYGIDYWILPAAQSTALPVVYEGGGFKVAALPSST